MLKFIKDFIKAIIKLFTALFLIFIFILFYWGIRFHQYEKELQEIASTFQTACQSSDGCIIEPESWEKHIEFKKDEKDENTYYYSKNGMDYKSTKDNFEISWHIAIDTYLEAKGGKNQPLEIERTLE